MAKNYAKRDFKSRPTRQPSRNFGWLWLITGLLLGLFGASLFFLKKHVVIVESSQGPSPSHASSASPEIVKPSPAPTPSKPSSAEAAASNGDVKYDFYTMLPKMQVQKDNQPGDGSSVAVAAPTSKPTKPLAEAEQSMFASQSMATGSLQKPETAASTESQAPIVAPQQPTPEMAAKPVSVPKLPATSSTTTPDTKYLVDFGGFSSFEKADARKAELIMAGVENAKIESTVKNNVTWYRVILGPYKNKTTAEKMLSKAQNQQLNGTIINATP